MYLNISMPFYYYDVFVSILLSISSGHVTFSMGLKIVVDFFSQKQHLISLYTPTMIGDNFSFTRH